MFFVFRSKMEKLFRSTSLAAEIKIMQKHPEYTEHEER